MAKTEWFRNNPYDVQAVRIEDTELWYRTAKKCSFVMLCKPLFFYREVGNDYYKKYILANTSKKHILSKYPNSSFWKKFFILNAIKGNIYRLFNLLSIEQFLVNRRNQVVYKKNIYVKKYCS